jgi:trk system potassium uptake protein TrkA
MRVVILGCGRVGSALALFMSKEGHDVVIIDRDSLAFRRLPNDFPGRSIKGVGIDEEILREAGIESADAFVSVTNGDNTNIMASQIAKVRFGVPKVVARLYDPVRASAFRDLDIHTICTTTLGAGAIRDFLLDRPGRTVDEYQQLCSLFDVEI